MLKNPKIFVILLLLLSFTVSSQEIRFTIDPRIPQDANKEPIMDSELFARLCLISSGAADDEIESYIFQLQELSIKLKKQIQENNITDTEKQAETVLLFLYENLLSSYSLNQTRVDEAIKTGVYNCVSASALFMYFAKTVNIQINAVETPLHCFCTISTETGSIDVETTNPYGVNPGIKKELSDSKNQTKYAIVPARNYRQRKNVDDRRFIAIIYTNRMSLLQKQKKDPETVGLALDAFMIQNFNEQGFQIFKQCTANAASSFSDKGKDEQGLQIIDKAIELYGTCPEYQQYNDFAITNIINKFANKHDYETSALLLEQYKEKLSSTKYKEFVEMISYNTLMILVDKEAFANSYEQIIAHKNIISEKNYTNLLVYAYSVEAKRLSKDSLYSEIDELLSKGLQDLPKNKTLQNQKNTYQKNYCIEIHNQAVRLINEENYEQAKKIITEALDKVGKNSMLEKDLKMLQ